MENIITLLSILTMIIAAFMLLDLAYNKIKKRDISINSIFKSVLVFLIGFLIYKLPNQFGFLALLFLFLFLLLTKMTFLTNKISKQTN